MTRSFYTASIGSGFKFGTNNYTDGADSKHDEVMVLGEQFLPTYTVFNTSAASVATANSHLLQIMAGASLKVRIRRIEVYQMGLATTAAFAQIALVRLTTAGTGGTALTPNPIDPGDAAAGSTGMTLPTVKGTEGANVWAGSCYFVQTAGASTPFNQPFLTFDFDKPRQKPLIIGVGATNGIALKNVTAIAAATVFTLAYIDEVVY